MTWSNFYITVATTAATVLGLLFVAVQFNLQRAPDEQPRLWLATARATWVVLASLFFVALVYLIPSLSPADRVPGIAAALVVSGLRIVATWLPVRREITHQNMAGRRRTLWVVVGPLVLYAVLIISSIALARGQRVQVVVGYVLIGLFALALRNSWDLLVELRVASSAGDGTIRKADPRSGASDDAADGPG